ncbi:MAG: class I SAM-dependent methyltransferase [Gemmatimonadota bacterium]|nr:class I SAM-dependent methyltransferase [Gemmatimonadota bacterium]
MAAGGVYNREFFTGSERASLDSARVIVPIIADLVRPVSVVDVGCGEGLWLTVFQECGATDILGLDGSFLDEDLLKIPRERFRPTDLRLPLDVGRRFDLAVSVEVAEHLPESRAASFVADLTSLAPIVLFSAAIPHQGGVAHLNERWQDYWAERFAAHDYVPIDCVRARVWSDRRVAWYYAQNLILYGRRDLVASDASLDAEYQRSRSWPLRIVHPTKYLSTADLAGVPLRRALRQLPTIAYHGLLRTLRRRTPAARA